MSITHLKFHHAVFMHVIFRSYLTPIPLPVSSYSHSSLFLFPCSSSSAFNCLPPPRPMDIFILVAQWVFLGLLAGMSVEGCLGIMDSLPIVTLLKKMSLSLPLQQLTPFFRERRSSLKLSSLLWLSIIDPGWGGGESNLVGLVYTESSSSIQWWTILAAQPTSPPPPQCYSWESFKERWPVCCLSPFLPRLAGWALNQEVKPQAWLLPGHSNRRAGFR